MKSQIIESSLLYWTVNLQWSFTDDHALNFTSPFGNDRGLVSQKMPRSQVHRGEPIPKTSEMLIQAEIVANNLRFDLKPTNKIYLGLI